MATTTTSNLSDIVRTAYDRLLYFALRSQPLFDMVADVKPAAQPHPGTTVTFTTMNDLSTATSALSETTSPTAQTLGVTQTSVTLEEYGNAVELTAKLRATGLIDIDEGAINVLAYNMVDSIDVLARTPLESGTNVRYSGGQTARADLDTADTFNAADGRYVVAKLRGNSALPKRGTYYYAFIHPDVSYDVQTDTGGGEWLDVHKYASPESIYAGEIGAFNGAIYIETPRAPVVTDGGSGVTDAYLTIFCGQQALAKGVAIEPHVVRGPVTDTLRRLSPWGWYCLLGYARFREGSLYRVESGSSIE